MKCIIGRAGRAHVRTLVRITYRFSQEPMLIEKLYSLRGSRETKELVNYIGKMCVSVCVLA